MEKFRKFVDTNTTLFVIILIFGVFSVIYGTSYILDTIEKNKEDYIASLTSEELLIYNLENEDYEGTIKDLVEEYIAENEITDYEVMQSKFGEEDLVLIKESYNKALEELYLNNESNLDFNLDTVIEDSKSRDTYTNDSVAKFVSINRELLNSELEDKLFTQETEQVIERYEEFQNAFLEELEVESKEERIYEFMKSAYEQITNYGETYVPEIHDPMVADLASEQFGIASSEAERIYIKMEMRGY